MSSAKLTQFILDQLRERQMSQREFAEFIGISPATLSKTIRFENPTEPSLDVLARLARATKTDICTLVALLYPDDTFTDPTVQLIAQRFAALTPEAREIADNFLLGLAFKSSQK